MFIGGGGYNTGSEFISQVQCIGGYNTGSDFIRSGVIGGYNTGSDFISQVGVIGARARRL